MHLGLWGLALKQHKHSYAARQRTVHAHLLQAEQAGLPHGSVVINATGMGKDTPGSPITNAGVFPRQGIAWEINHRGGLDFWHQAKAQEADQNLIVEDGWLFFLYG